MALDQRYSKIINQENKDLKNVNNLYNSMINNSNKFYNNQVNAVKDYQKTQTDIQNEQNKLALGKIEQQKEWANQDYVKEQKASYADWQKQSNQYGANAEANAKMINSGYSESSQVQMYTAYQNRVATARESFNRIITEYDNQMNDAIIQNKAKLAEIAYNSLKERLSLALEGFQYKNTLLEKKLTARNDVKDRYYNRWQDVRGQINTEKALKEQIREFNANLKLEKQKLSLSSGSSGGGSYRSYSSRSSSSSRKGGSVKISKSKRKSSVKATKKATKKSSSRKSSALSRRMIELKAQSPYLYQSLSDYKKVIGK